MLVCRSVVTSLSLGRVLAAIWTQLRGGLRAILSVFSGSAILAAALGLGRAEIRAVEAFGEAAPAEVVATETADDSAGCGTASAWTG